MTSELEIRDWVHAFYTDLFTSDCIVILNHMERAAVLSLITKKVSSVDNAKLIRGPSNAEIDVVVMGFHNEKYRGLDGITTIKDTSFVLAFHQDGFYDMVKSFWRDGVMSLSSLAGVIKLILKEWSQLAYQLASNYDDHHDL